MENKHKSRLHVETADIPLIVGPKGKTILNLATLHGVRIELPDGDEKELTIHGRNHLKALEAVQELLNGPKTADKTTPSHEHSSSKMTSKQQSTHITFIKPAYTFLNYRLYVPFIAAISKNRL